MRLTTWIIYIRPSEANAKFTLILKHGLYFHRTNEKKKWNLIFFWGREWWNWKPWDLSHLNWEFGSSRARDSVERMNELDLYSWNLRRIVIVEPIEHCKGMLPTEHWAIVLLGFYSFCLLWWYLLASCLVSQC